MVVLGGMQRGSSLEGGVGRLGAMGSPAMHAHWPLHQVATSPGRLIHCSDPPQDDENTGEVLNVPRIDTDRLAQLANIEVGRKRRQQLPGVGGDESGGDE